MAIVYRITKNEDSDLVFLKGNLDEDAGLPLNDLLEKIGPKCVINLKEIMKINSLGVRLWVRFMRNFEANRSVTLEECTPEVIIQINMIPNFKGKSVINSLYARYQCSHCGNEKLQLFTLGVNMPKKGGPYSIEEPTCPKCGAKMEMEEFEDEFFACLGSS